MSILDTEILEETDVCTGFPAKTDNKIHCFKYNVRYGYEWLNTHLFNHHELYGNYTRILGITTLIYNPCIQNIALRRKHGNKYRIRLGYIYEYKSSYLGYYPEPYYLYDFDKFYDTIGEALEDAYKIMLRLKQEPSLLTKTYYLQNNNNKKVLNKILTRKIIHFKKFMGKYLNVL